MQAGRKAHPIQRVEWSKIKITKTIDSILTMATEEFCESHLSDLIAHLYDAAMDTALWPGTASRIAEVFGSTSTVLKLQAGDAQVTLLECTDNLVVSAQQQAWAEDWHRKDMGGALGCLRHVTHSDR